MIEHLSHVQLVNIATRGGSLEVNGARFSAAELIDIAVRLQPGASLKIYNCNSKSEKDLINIASRKNQGQVIFC